MKLFEFNMIKEGKEKMFFAFFLGALFDTGAVPVLIAFPLIIGLICYSHKYNKLNNYKG